MQKCLRDKSDGAHFFAFHSARLNANNLWITKAQWALIHECALHAAIGWNSKCQLQACIVPRMTLEELSTAVCHLNPFGFSAKEWNTKTNVVLFHDSISIFFSNMSYIQFLTKRIVRFLHCFLIAECCRFGGHHIRRFANARHQQ